MHGAALLRGARAHVAGRGERRLSASLRLRLGGRERLERVIAGAFCNHARGYYIQITTCSQGFPKLRCRHAFRGGPGRSEHRCSDQNKTPLRRAPRLPQGGASAALSGCRPRVAPAAARLHAKIAYGREVDDRGAAGCGPVVGGGGARAAASVRRVCGAARAAAGRGRPTSESAC